MRGRARERGLIKKAPKTKCGSLVVKLSENPICGHRYCKRWDCKRCREFKIKKYQRVMKGAKLGQVTYISERPPIKTDRDLYSFGNFIKKHTNGTYFAIKSDLKVLLVTRNNHPGAIRKQTQTVIDTLLPEVLNEKWDGIRLRRFTHSRNLEPVLTIKDDANIEETTREEIILMNADNRDYAKMVLEHKQYDKANEIIKEFRALKTDYKRAEWLILHESEVILFERGEEIIEEYYRAPRSAAGIGI